MARAGKRIALILPKGHDYALRLIEGVLASLPIRDRSRFQFVEIPYDEDRAPAAVYSVPVDGALVWTHPGASWVLDLRDRGVKVVSFNSEWLSEGIPCVGMDLEATINSAVAHLVALERHHAAYVGHKTANSLGKQRQRDAFLEGSRARGWTTAALDVPGIPSDERQRLGEPAAERELIEFLRSLPLPAMLFCDDDYVAALVCRVADHLRLVVPDDLAVLGYFDMAIARFSVPTISSVPGSGQGVGAAGMRLLAGMLAGKAPPAAPTFVPPPAVVSRESTGGKTIRDDDIRRVNELIQKSACQGLTVDQLLSRVAMSQKTLNKRFEAVFGRTPGAAIRHVRAERAKELLATTDLSVSRVSDMCGFDEPSNFNLFFKREVGCTPGQYRANVR
jgi:LacI family transcriptional regulator